MWELGCSSPVERRRLKARLTRSGLSCNKKGRSWVMSLTSLYETQSGNKSHSAEFCNQLRPACKRESGRPPKAEAHAGNRLQRRVRSPTYSCGCLYISASLVTLSQNGTIPAYLEPYDLNNEGFVGDKKNFLFIPTKSLSRLPCHQAMRYVSVQFYGRVSHQYVKVLCESTTIRVEHSKKEVK
jgi:hypothetical protein